MKVSLETGSLAEIKAEVIVLPLFFQEDAVKVLTKEPGLDKKLGKAMLAAMKTMVAEEFAGKFGQQLWLPCYESGSLKKLCLFGMGKESDLSANCYRKVGAHLARKLGALPAKPAAKKNLLSMHLILRGTKLGHDAALEAVVEGLILGSFSFSRYKTQKDESKHLEPFYKRIGLSVSGNLSKHKLDQAVKKAVAMGTSTNLARELVAEPPSEMTPSRLAQEAKKIAAKADLEVKIMTPTQIEKLGMGALLGVARGAKEEARLITLKYTAPRSKRTIGLIGKGITFDSGGLSLKPAQSMEHMKYDMSGAAACLAAMQIIGELKPKVSVLMVVAATENMPGDNALHPGDVLKSMNGKTIEVNNTDAEGRLILADAITYAIKEGVTELIDIATLTGAVVTALGRVAAGIMGSQSLVDAVIESGKGCGEKFWQLPLFDEYKEGLRSDIADLKNAGSRGEAGSSSAGMFIKEFTENLPWAHLDVAGVSWLEREKDEWNKGGTGFGARTLSSYVLSQN